MVAVDETIWDLDEHTKAKHEILSNYLGGWFPILARWSGRIVYIDGFAGPGVYSKGEEGSPIIALRTASEHLLRPHTWSEMIFIFIEKDTERDNFLERAGFRVLRFENRFVFQDPEYLLSEIKKCFKNNPDSK
jgi:three-Cys-motif partner protein